MNAQSKFASRFTTPADPTELFRLLQGMADDKGASSEGEDPDTKAFAEAASNGRQAKTPPPDQEQAAEQAAAKPAPDHDAQGRFAKGNQGGPGNPYNRQVAALRKQLLDIMTPTVFQQAAEALVIQACSGNVAALKLLFQYSLGKPLEAVHPDRVALDEAALLRESNQSGRNWRELFGAPFLETMMEFCRLFQSLTTEKFARRFAADATAVFDAQDKAKQQAEARRARAEARRARKAQADAASQAVPAAAASSEESAAPPVVEAASPAAPPAETPPQPEPTSPEPPGPHVGRGTPDLVPTPDRTSPEPASVATSSPTPSPSASDTTATTSAAEQSVNVASAADPGKIKAPPLANAANGRPTAGAKSVPDEARPARSAGRKPRAA